MFIYSDWFFEIVPEILVIDFIDHFNNKEIISHKKFTLKVFAKQNIIVIPSIEHIPVILLEI